MRENKFRYVYEEYDGSLFFHYVTLKCIEEQDFYDDKELISRDQFTGLQDCKGNDIYEGDILSFDREKFPDDDECNYSVVFEDGSFRKSYKGWSDNLRKPGINKTELSILHDHVIGNIHEGIK